MQPHFLTVLAFLSHISDVQGAFLRAPTRKAGLSGYIGIQRIKAFRDLAPYISWYTDYNPNTPSVGNVEGIPMLWGGATSPCDVAPGRIQLFQAAVARATPRVMLGYYEPDCFCPDSANMTVQDAAYGWNTFLVPLAQRGTILGSPSMCKQFDEDFLEPFSALATRSWDATSIHINKPDLAGVIADVEYYRKYGKPIFVSEFACVFDQGGFNACTNQSQINQFIYDAVIYFESQDDVVGYGPSNGAGLGTVWPLTKTDGTLSQTGLTYLYALQILAQRQKS